MTYAPVQLAFRGRRVVTPEGEVPAAVLVANETIHAVVPPGQVPAAVPVVDLPEPDVLMPGVVDTHVHFNEPGRTEWEGFATGTAAAAAGGVTTAVDMPLNAMPATTTVHGLDMKRAAAEGSVRVDVGFWGGLVPGNEEDLEPLWRAGVLGFKCFLVPSGVMNFPHVGEADLARAMPILAGLGAPLLVHAEMPGVVLAATALALDARRPADPRRYATYLSTRPARAEVEAIALVGRLAAEHRCRVHVVHVATGAAAPALRAAREAGAEISAETCPHYLRFAAEDVPDGATEFKCAPPIREAEERNALWAALERGDLSMVVSDHSPCVPGMKRLSDGDFLDAWGGIASLEVALPAVWTGARARSIGLDRVCAWMSEAPGRLAGLERRKGAIEAGRDADLVVFRPDADTAVDPDALHQKHPVTPYAGTRLAGRVMATYVRGRAVYADGETQGPPAGRLITRPTR
ncbi:MAG TPA: allantoinase AllB [Longimicrobiales bacterium]|nr:allantoinase AllB [Longimicrobiales bacterium]